MRFWPVTNRELFEELQRLNFRVGLLLIRGGRMSQQLDDLKAAQADSAVALGELGTSLSDVANDVDKLLTLMGSGPEDLTEAINQATSIRDTARSLATAASAAAGKFDSTV